MFGTIETAPEGVGTTDRSLTQRIGISDWRAVMDTTRRQHPEVWNAKAIPEAVAQRAHENVDKLGDGCWISRYSVASHGYAQVGWWHGGRSHGVTAHRAAWTHVNGPVPVGKTVDHLCKVRRCVNPEHLRILSNRENARRNNGQDWPLGECSNGHAELDAGKCRQCRALHRRRYAWRQKHGAKPMPNSLLLGAERRAA